MKLPSLLTALAGALAFSIAPPAVAVPAPVDQPTAGVDAVPAGSYLTTIVRGAGTSDGGIAARSERLVLVSPTGGTRTVYARKVTNRTGAFRLADWSADGRTALLLVGGIDGSRPVVVDVQTGAADELDAARLSTAILDPAGAGILASVWKGRHSNTQVLERVTWAGAVTTLAEPTNGNVIAGPGGTVITQNPDQPHLQLMLSTSTGTVVHEFRHRGYCTPVRWWDQTHLMEMCGQDLYLVDPGTGRFDQLTSGHGPGDYGHLDARYLGSKLYVQVAGGCGYTYVARVTKKGTKQVVVPGAVGNVLMVNAVGPDLILVHAASCDGARPRAMLTRFDPVRGKEKSILILKRHEAFGRIMLLGDVRASTY